MRTPQARRIGVGAGIAAVAATALIAGGASASSGPAAATSGRATIEMKNQGKHKTYFTGPKTVKHGAKLKILNSSDPKQIGPHTFTLVTKADLPASKKARKACQAEPPTNQVCIDVIKAQKANPQTGVVKKPTVDVGKKGWDKSFGKKGDTWFTPAKGDSQSRRVSAPVGTTLYYFCAVHPEMHGKIKVVK